MSVRLQELLHKYEVGAGAYIVRFAVVVAAVVALALAYDLAEFRNLATQEGMDSAQLARNIANGKGYTTSFVRPLSLHLLEQQGTNSAAKNEGHPDLANAPVYPVLLAGVLKLNPLGDPDLSKQERFSVFPPDLWIAIFNQLLFAVAAWMVFRLARRLFDEPVAWASAAVFLLSELLWRFTLSGLSTILLMIIFLGLAGLMASIEFGAREQATGSRSLVPLALLAGLLAGLAGMTRYSCACLILPVVVLLVLSPSPRRTLLVMAAIAAFCAVMLPWTIRNFQLSGTPFGTAGFAVMETTSGFPGDQLQRSLHPAISQINTGEYWNKLIANTRDIAVNELPKLGGNWVSALFLASLLIGFRNPVLGRIRIFIVLSLISLVVAQALARTSLSTDSPEVNSENLLVIAAPLVFIYGTALFLILRDQLALPGPAARALIWVAFYAILAAPLLLTLFGQHPSPVVYPPYYPPWLQQKSGAVGESQLIMSDVPWAVAWYGKRASVWLALKHIDRRSDKFKDDFYAVDRVQHVNALYLTSKSLKTIDLKAVADWAGKETADKDWELVQKMVTELGQRLLDLKKDTNAEQLKALYKVIERNWIHGGGDDWDSFVLGIFIKREVPTGFPLQRASFGIMPEIFLRESEREPLKTIQ
jgi:hypothetical protein